MILELVKHTTTKRVSPQSVLDYVTFSKRFSAGDADDLNLFERFIAARSLIGEGFDTYLDPSLRHGNGGLTFHADVVGVKPGDITVAFCITGTPNAEVWEAIRRVSESKNGKALILSSQEIDNRVIDLEAPSAMDKGKVRVETLGWFDDVLENPLRETLRTIELLVNETRMRMLTPLLGKSAMKREFRARINPKLVYHNIAELSKAGILDEPTEGTYELSELGRTVLTEFITFLERTRRTLDDRRVRR